MKILLIGEFSGFYNSLAEGLKLLGHEVFLANTGDGYRKFYAEYNWMAGKHGKIGKGLGIFNLISHKRLFAGYDVVQVIVTKLNRFLWLNRLFVNNLVNKNQKVFWTPAGNSDLITKYWAESKDLRYGVCDILLQEAKNRNETLGFIKQRVIDYENWFVNRISGIIPIMFEYAQPFRNHPKNIGTIPLPINIDKIKYIDNIVRQKMIFYHGITRPAEKGSKYIHDAFKIMRCKYGNVAEFICNEKLPYKEYLKVLISTNVILDQTNSFSSGMNGLISLAQGKIVMGGGDPIGFGELGYKTCPIINLTPNVDQICDSIEKVIYNKDHIREMGIESRKFIETYHDYKVVATKYIEKWKLS